MLLKMGESSATFHVYLLIAIFKLKMNSRLQERRKIACVFSSRYF